MKINDTFPYLRDPRALAEIRKHKWIESQKAGTEVGFATAAFDWIQKYGLKWQEAHLKNEDNAEIFVERRRYRRFALNCAAELIRNNAKLIAQTINLSFFGLLCKTNEYISMGSEIIVQLSSANNIDPLDCRAVITRVIPVGTQEYELFLSFDESSQRAISSWNLLRRQAV